MFNLGLLLFLRMAELSNSNLGSNQSWLFVECAGEWGRTTISRNDASSWCAQQIKHYVHWKAQSYLFNKVLAARPVEADSGKNSLISA